MHTHHPHFPGTTHDPFDAGNRRRYRDSLEAPGPFDGPGPRRPRNGGRPRFGPPDGSAVDPGHAGLGPQGAGRGPGGGPFGPGFWPGFGPGFGPGFEQGSGRGGRGFGANGAPGFARGGHRRRAGRGDIRAAVLLLLAERPRHGYELIREIAERTDGAWQPSPGAIYPALALLEDEGFVTLAAEGGRRLASLTEAGRTYATEHAAELGDPFADATVRTPRPTRALRGAVQSLGAATWQVAAAGNDAQAASALAIVERATKDLYLLLAGETPSTAPATDRSTES